MRELQLDAENLHQLAYFRMLINLLTATAQNEIKETIRGIGPRLILLYHAIRQSCHTAVYDDLVIPRYMTILLYRGGLYDDLVIPQ